MDEECRLLYSAGICWLYIGMSCDVGDQQTDFFTSIFSLKLRDQQRDKVCHVDDDNNINIVTMAKVLILNWTCILM